MLDNCRASDVDIRTLSNNYQSLKWGKYTKIEKDWCTDWKFPFYFCEINDRSPHRKITLQKFWKKKIRKVSGTSFFGERLIGCFQKDKNKKSTFGAFFSTKCHNKVIELCFGTIERHSQIFNGLVDISHI